MTVVLIGNSWSAKWPGRVSVQGDSKQSGCCFSGLSQAEDSAYLPIMDLNALMKQAQAMQQKLQDAQAKMAETTASGTSGGGLVTVALKGAGEVTAVTIDDSLLVPGEGEILADLIVAAHADARRKLDEANGALMREAAGPMAGMNIPGMPKLF
jgi:DNA-binding YbaB/EbfC family protein